MKIPGLSATIIHHNKVSVLLVGLIVRLGTPREFVNFLSTFYGSFSDFNFFRKSSFSKKNLVFMGRYWSANFLHLSIFVNLQTTAEILYERLELQVWRFSSSVPSSFFYYLPSPSRKYPDFSSLFLVKVHFYPDSIKIKLIWCRCNSLLVLCTNLKRLSYMLVQLYC